MNKKDKHEQLGMNASTAQHRLVKDILWSLLVETGKNKCFVCGKEMSRETFSIEHKKPWLHEPNAEELFWDLNNITFSHLKCNVDRRRIYASENYHGTTNGYSYHKCRCELCKQANSEYTKSKYSKDKRRKRYVEKGY